MNFKKVSDIQENTVNQLKQYRAGNGLYNYDFTKIDFTVKKAGLKFFSLNKSGYLAHSGTIYANVSNKDSNNLYISLGVENDPYATKDFRIESHHLANIIRLLCSYWIHYKESKQLKRVIFSWSTSRSYIEDTVIEEAMGMINYQEVKNPSSVLDSSWGGYSTNKVYREKEDLKFSFYEYIESELQKAKTIHPSFVIEKRHSSSMFKPCHDRYYYNNESFYLSPSLNRENLVLKRTDKEDLVFPIQDGVVLKVLKTIDDDMKLLNLIKPSIKQFKHFTEKHLLVTNFKDEDLEEKLRNLDEIIGMGQTENEFYMINNMVANTREEHDKSHRMIKSKMDFFKIPSVETTFFKEHYGDEFVFYRFITENYHWFVMYSKNEKDIWFFTSDNPLIPEETKTISKNVFELRRNTEAMSKINTVLTELEYLFSNKMLKVQNRILESDFNDIKRHSEVEYGKKWREECGFK